MGKKNVYNCVRVRKTNDSRQGTNDQVMEDWRKGFIGLIFLPAGPVVYFKVQFRTTFNI